MTDINIHIDDYLILDYLEEQLDATDDVSVSDNGNNYDFDEYVIGKKKKIFNPEESGEYTIEYNNESIKVYAYNTPNSVDTQYNIDEGSGTTIKDSVGSTNATKNSLNWISKNNSYGDYALEGTRSTGEYIETDSSYSVSNWTLFGWIYPQENNKYDQIGFVGDIDGKTVGHKIYLGSTEGTLLTSSGNGSSDDIEPTTDFVSNNNWGFFALSHNNSLSDEKRLITWSTDSEISDHSYSSDYTPSNVSTYKIGGVSNKPSINGFYDYFGFSFGSVIPKSDLETIWKITNNR